MTGKGRVLSIYEGFFAGGARALHSSVVAGLHSGGRQAHTVLSIYAEMRRETLLQRMQTDARYLQLRAAGVPVCSLGRRPDRPAHPGVFSPAEVAKAARHATPADLVLSLKEQPLPLINHPDFPHRSVVVCLHRSDPDARSPAVAELRTAVTAGRVAAIICCAESTRTAYESVGIPTGLLHVIPNGVDLQRFRPGSPRTARTTRKRLGVPMDAPVITLAARYDPMKNVPLFLRAARDYLHREPTGHILMCGAGMSTDNPLLGHDLDTAFADEPALRTRLTLLGLRTDMESIYTATDVVTLTSATGEAAPLSLIEGMMCGAIPVTTDVGDSAAIVAGHGLVTAADPHAISTAWIEAFARRHEFTPALLASRARFCQNRMIASYSTLIDRTRRGASTVL